jgi:hypothetical protein
LFFTFILWGGVFFTFFHFEKCNFVSKTFITHSIITRFG